MLKLKKILRVDYCLFMSEFLSDKEYRDLSNVRFFIILYLSKKNFSFSGMKLHRKKTDAMHSNMCLMMQFRPKYKFKIITIYLLMIFLIFFFFFISYDLMQKLASQKNLN